MRIQSFLYSREQTPENPFRTIYEEVAALEKAWLPKSGQYRDLIIDVLDNSGGNLPIAYYQILFQKDFSELENFYSGETLLKNFFSRNIYLQDYGAL